MNKYTQKIAQPRRNGKILTNIQLAKTESGRNRNLKRSITNKMIESVIKNLPINKGPGPFGFSSEFYLKLKEALTPICLKLFQKNHRVENTPKLILRNQCCPDTKTRKRILLEKKTAGQYPR